MLENLVVGVLQRRLGQFIEADHLGSLRLGLWSGKIRLDNVVLRPDALYTLGLPFAVKEGRVAVAAAEFELAQPYAGMCPPT